MIRLWKLFWLERKIRQVRKKLDELDRVNCHELTFTREEIKLFNEYHRL